jgi:putative zinc finger/helix-turn-helix YgiT family protein
MSKPEAHNCTNHLETARRNRDFPIHGTTIPVDEEFYRCTICGEEQYSYEQAMDATRRAGEAYRERNGFLQPDQIAGLRRRWGVTQTQLEDALGLGRKTVARWEAGRVLQTRALDNLLRAIDRFPQVLQFLAERQGITVDPDPRWSQSGAEASSGLLLPRSLVLQLQDRAAREGTSTEAYVAMLLAQSLNKLETDRLMAELSERLDLALGRKSSRDPMAPELVNEEPDSGPTNRRVVSRKYRL